MKYIAQYLNEQMAGMTVGNIYDLSSRSYLIKTSRGSNKCHLFIDSGVMTCINNEIQSTKDKPNNFAQKLRKHLKSLFVDKIEQIGVERVMRVSFRGADPTN